MMEYYNLIKNFAFTGDVGMWTYWLPLLLCAVGYTIRTIKQIQHIKAYELGENVRYVQDLTVGTVLWRVVLTVTPIVNVLALSFSLGFDMLGWMWKWIENILDIKLVSKK
jgi:hypothetical protein